MNAINMVGRLVLIAIFLTSCSILEVNIVQRTALENGEGISSSSVDTKLNKEESKMELLVPLK